MGSDMAGFVPTEAEFKIVTGNGHTAIYSRQTDGIYQRDLVENWHRTQLFIDPDKTAANALKAVNKRMEMIDRPDLCDPAADEPFPEKLPRISLEAKTPLQMREAGLVAELDVIRARIEAGETEL